jgi:hypothetical protein
MLLIVDFKMSYYNNELSGISFSGVPLNPNSSGSLDTGNFSDGYGQVYGIYWNTGANPSFGLTPHSLTDNSAPSESGSLYWTSPLPFGQEVQLKFSGITYYDEKTDIYFPDTGNIFGQSRSSGFISDFEIKPIKVRLEDIVEDSIAPSLLFLKNEELSQLNRGIYITKERFNRTGNFDLTHGSNNQSVSGLLNSLNVANPIITGYYAYASGEGMQMFDGGGNFKDHMFGGILNTPIEKSELFLKPFTVQLESGKFHYGTGDTVDCWKVVSFFNNQEERMSDVRRRIEVKNSSESKYVTFFTGYNSGTSEGLYLTYIKGPYTFRCPPDWSLESGLGCDINNPLGSGLYVNDLNESGLCFKCLDCSPCPGSSFPDPNGAICPGWRDFNYTNECGQTNRCFQCPPFDCEIKYGLNSFYDPGMCNFINFRKPLVNYTYTPRPVTINGEFCWKCVACPSCESLGLFSSAPSCTFPDSSYFGYISTPTCGYSVGCYACGTRFPYPPYGVGGDCCCADNSCSTEVVNFPYGGTCSYTIGYQKSQFCSEFDSYITTQNDSCGGEHCGYDGTIIYITAFSGLYLEDLISSCSTYNGRITYSILYNVTCAHDGGTTDAVQFHY